MEDLIKNIEELISSTFSKEYIESTNKTLASNKEKYAIVGEGVMRLFEDH